MILSIKEQGKSPAGPRKDPKNAVAAAKLVVSQRRRRQLVLMEDRRRRGIAFENLAMEMLGYLDNSEDVKVGITELQERLGVA